MIVILFRLHEDEMGKAMDAVSAGSQDIFTVLDSAVQDHVRQMTNNICGTAWHGNFLVEYFKP